MKNPIRSFAQPFSRKSRSFLLAGLIATACAWGATPAGAQLIINGSFEDGLVTANFGFAGYSTSNSSIANWTGQANADGINSGINANYYDNSYTSCQFDNNGITPDGTYVAFMQSYGGSTATLSQAITGLVDGQAYELSYYVNARNDGGTPMLTVKLGTDTLAGPTGYTPVDGFLARTNPYNLVSVDFTYLASWGSTLSFTSGGSDGSILLDNVSLVAVPEPQTWALAALGVSAVVFRLRRQQRVS